MNSKIDTLKGVLEGDVLTDAPTIQEYSHDTSLFEVIPSAVLFPKNEKDVKQLVKWVSEQKKTSPELSITARSAGTDMSGGAINDSLILVFKKYMNKVGLVEKEQIWAQPGALYRDFEVVTLKSGMLMPSYPASRDMAAIGGMVANNAGGEKSLTYGKIENFVSELRIILADGQAYDIKPLNKKQLQTKIAQNDYEGNIYKNLFDLISANYAAIMAAKPNVTKNSTGYKLWDIWNKQTGVFDMSQLFVGSQGTLGLIVDTKFNLVKAKKHSGVLVGYARDLKHMGELINILKNHNPTTIEAFDEHTVGFAFRFFLKFREGIGWWGLFKMAVRLIPDALILLRGTPKMIFMASFDDDDYGVIKQKIDSLKEDIDVKHWRIITEKAETEAKSERFWMMRRKSFKLLRDNVKGGKHTAPFIDDLVVPTEHIAKFWPEIVEILDRYELLYTIAGHLGDGNFHIIPLMKLSDPKERAKIEPCLKEVIQLIKKYDGVMSGEHNDGLIRSPFLNDIYGSEITNLFADVKNIFDPLNIFNPHKKTDSSWEFSAKHIRKNFDA